MMIFFIGYEQWFERLQRTTSQGLPYDYDSIMHYSSTKYSTSNASTIVPLNETVRLGIRKELLLLGAYPTKFDYLHINLLYCSGKIIFPAVEYFSLRDVA